MFSIGEFSRITNLSIKALRLYHEMDLLVPSKVDEFTGYRSYSYTEVEKARMISYLKNMEFSLREIKDILENYFDEAELIEFLERQKEVIEKKIQQYKDVAFSLDIIIKKEKEIKMALQSDDFEVEEKEVETMLIASIRMKGKYSDCGPAFMKIGKKMGRYICGKPFNLYYDAEYKEEGADFEVCFPVNKGKPDDEIGIRELKGCKCISLIHKGPYEELGRSYQKVWDHVKEKGLKPIIPSREIYLKGPGMILKGNPKNYLTEIQLVIEQ